MKNYRILILDDDPCYQDLADSVIRGQFETICPKCSEIVAGINDDLGGYLMKIVDDENPNVILTDIMYGYSRKLMYAGLDISKFIKENYSNIPVIGMSNGFCSQKQIEESGMFKLLAKSKLRTGLIPTIQECLEKK